jgi:hypothetical protein
MTETAVQDFRVGRVLATAWSVYMKNFVPFSTVALVLLLPLLFVQLFLVPDPSADLSEEEIYAATRTSIALGAIYAVLSMLLTQLVTATLVYGTIQEMRHHSTSTGEALTRGLQLALPVLGVVIVASIAVGVGALLLVVPGIILFVMFWVAIPVAVVERPGVIASLKRSAFLTKGNRWRIFGLVVVLWLIFVLISMAISLAFAAAEAWRVYPYIDYVLTVFLTAVFAVVSAVGYHDLRLLKDGVDVETIAAVFD